MFATLLGALPRPTTSGSPRDARRSGPEPRGELDAAVRRVLEAQEAAGLELLTDGRLRWPDPFGSLVGLDGVSFEPDARGGGTGLRVTTLPGWPGPLAVDAWRFAARATGLPVKQSLLGPYTLARRVIQRGDGWDIDAVGFAFAAALHSEIEALAGAGCPVIEIEEPDAIEIGGDPVERRRFRDLHQAVVDGVRGVHLSLAITGGSADTAGAETILAAPYASLAVDLIDGPDNWRLVRSAPGERGIVCGAVSTRAGSDDGPELLLWAAGYAASSDGRGAARVGLSTAGSLAALSWDEAELKLRRLGDAVRIARLSAEAATRELDPRALDLRSTATGEYRPPKAGSRRPGPS